MAALELVRSTTTPWAGEASDDPLIASITDFMALLEASWTTGEAAALLHVDVSRIRQRLRERSLYGIEYDGERRLPRFERGHVLPGLREVLAVIWPAGKRTQYASLRLKRACALLGNAAMRQPPWND